MNKLDKKDMEIIDQAEQKEALHPELAIAIKKVWPKLCHLEKDRIISSLIKWI